MRVARPTDDIARLMPFYRDGLGLLVLAEFKDHAGFDGVMLGDPSAAWHMEFTYHADHPGARAPTEENLLVLYLPDTQAWRLRTQQIEAAGFAPVPALNPYWDAHGRSYADPDGWRTVLARMAWTL